MNRKGLYRKMQKAFTLAGENPQTNEEKNAYKIAMDLKRKLDRKNHRKPLQLSYGGLIPYSLIGSDKVDDKKIKWMEYLKVTNETMISLQIIPDTSTRNYKTEDIARLIVQLHKLPVDRFKRDGFKLTYKLQEKVCFEIKMTNEEVSFYLHVPKSLETFFTKKLQSVWEKCTIIVCKDNTTNYSEEKSAVQELIYRKHDLYSLDTDSKTTDPLGSILEASRLIGKDEKASVFTTFEPIHQLTVQAELQDVWRKLRDGSAPKKWSFSLRDIGLLIGYGISNLLKEITGAINELLSDDKEESIYTKKYVANPEATKLAIDNLHPATKQKPSKQILKVQHLVIAESPDERKASLINQAICNSYSDIAADNDLVSKEIRKKSKKKDIINAINQHRPPKVNIRSNLMSIGEAGNFMKLPGDELISKFASIKSIKKREIEVDKALLQDGILLGSVTYRGVTVQVKQPIKSFNELCLPWVYMGGMGMGKSFAIVNKAVQYNKNGFGCLIVDPAKGEIGDEIERILPPENVIRLDVGKIAMSLDWCEIEYVKKNKKNRLANAALSFFNQQSDEAGAQTARYLKAAVFAMNGYKMDEVVEILEDPLYRKECINAMQEGFHKVTLQEFHDLSPAMQTKVKMPIYNRLDIILGDEFLSECMKSDLKIDMVQLMESNKCIIIDARKDDLGPEGVDLICNIISTKIDIAMVTRDQEKAHPFFILFDELHQMQRSTTVWKNAAVESRKYRVGYNFILHGFDQVDRKLLQIIQDAGPNYCLFRSSENTFSKLEKNIRPFTPEDGIKLERFHAINIINADNRVIEPFICRMNDPR